MNGLRQYWQKWRKIGQWMGLFSLCFVLVVSCSRPQTTPPPNTATPGNNRVTIGTTLKIRTVDPADAYELASGNLLLNLGDRLYSYESGTTKLVPQLATALPTVSEDGLTYTIPLRQGVVFHDGTPFNAEAMAFSLRRFQENQGPPSVLLKDVASINATGDYELTLKLKQPFAAFPSLLAFSGLCPVSPKAYEIGAGQFKPSTFVGTGPYKLAELGTDIIRLEVFDQYWGEKPKNSGVDLQIFSSSANLFNAFRTAAVDVAANTLDAEQISSLEKQVEKQGWQEITADGNTLNYMTVNVYSEPLNKPEVRQALAAITDRPLLIQRVLQNQGSPAYSLIPSSFEVSQAVFKDYGDGNAAKAKELLTKAGYSPTNPAVIEVWYSSNSAKRGLIANTLKAIVDQKMDGILQIKLNSVESTTAFQNLEKGVYPTFLLDWYADFFDADNYIQPFLDCGEGTVETGCKTGASQSQGSFYYNPRMNELIAQERKENNPEKRQEIFTEIQKILGQDVPFIPLWLDKDYLFAQKGVKGVSLEPTQQFRFSSLSKA